MTTGLGPYEVTYLDRDLSHPALAPLRDWYIKAVRK